MVVIIGAGLSGLVCGWVLQAAGVPVTVLESEPSQGGRVRTEQHPEGFLLDRGFQVLFTAYPAAQRYLSYRKLDLRPFVPGALVALDGSLHTIADPLRDPGRLLSSLQSPVFAMGDKLRVLRLRAATQRASRKEIFTAPDRSAEEFLHDVGFSARFIDRFARPFYGGIFLDRSLATSAAMFRFTFKMLAQGDTVVPARGMQQIPDQLAAAFRPGTIRYGTAVESLARAQGRVIGVRTESGEQIEADVVVVATDPATAARLIGDETIPHRAVSSTCVYFATQDSLYEGPLIVLNANPEPYINNLVQITNVAPSYAPRGNHLVSLTLLDASEDDEASIEARCREELAALFPRSEKAGMRLLRVVRIPFSQFAQPPGIYQTLPGNATTTAGLYLASEATVSSSIEGAMRSGGVAARQILAARNGDARASA